VKPFSARRGGGAYVSLDQLEARLLANLAAQVAELVRDGSAEPVGPQDPLEVLVGLGEGPVQPPDDPVLQRLLPDAYRDDAEGAAEFRRFTEQGLREGKVRNALTVIESLTAGGMTQDEMQVSDVEVDVDLDADQVQAWLRCLNDIRLSLATRLEITEDDDRRSAIPDNDPAAVLHDIYDWLGFAQETLVQSLGD